MALYASFAMREIRPVLKTAIGRGDIDGGDGVFVLVVVSVAQRYAFLEEVIAGLGLVAGALRDSFFGAGGELGWIDLARAVAHQAVIVNQHAGLAFRRH